MIWGSLRRSRTTLKQSKTASLSSARSRRTQVSTVIGWRFGEARIAIDHRHTTSHEALALRIRKRIRLRSQFFRSDGPERIRSITYFNFFLRLIAHAFANDRHGERSTLEPLLSITLQW